MVARVDVGLDSEPDWQVLVVVAEISHSHLIGVPPRAGVVKLIVCFEDAHPLIANIHLASLDHEVGVVATAAEDLSAFQLSANLELDDVLTLLDGVCLDL